jgi:hypothetical protein
VIARVTLLPWLTTALPNAGALSMGWAAARNTKFIDYKFSRKQYIYTRAFSAKFLAKKLLQVPRERE